MEIPKQIEPQTRVNTKRFDYVEYDDETHEAQLSFKQMYSALAVNIEHLPQSRGQALALTQLEESYMWVGKALRDYQLAKNGDAVANERRKQKEENV